MEGLKRVFLLVFPITYIIYICYCRFHIREPQMLYSSKTTLILFCYVFLLFLTICRLYLALKRLGIIKRPPITNKYLLNVFVQWSNLSQKWDHLWVHFYQTIVDRFFKLNFLLLALVRKFYHNQKAISYILILSDLFSQTVVSMFFLIDIVIFKQFVYFYYVIPLLMVPLIIKTFLSILLQFHIDNSISLAKAIILVDSNLYEKGYSLTVKFHPDFVLPDYIKDLDDFMLNHHIPVISIVDILLNYNLYKKDLFYDYLVVFITILYLIGWSILIFLY